MQLCGHKVEPNKEDIEIGGDYDSPSSRVKIVPQKDDKLIIEPEKRSSPTSSWRPGRRPSRDDEIADSFPEGIPYALRLKMSRRRRTHQRRKQRRSRNLKPRAVVPVDRRNMDSPSKRQQMSETRIPTMSYVAPLASSVQHIRLGPGNRSVQPVRIGPQSRSVPNVRLGPQSRSVQNTRLEQNRFHERSYVGNRGGDSADRVIDYPNTDIRGFESVASGIDTADLDVRFAKTPPVSIRVQPSPRRTSPSDDLAGDLRYEVPAESRVGPSANRRRRRRRRRRHRNPEVGAI